MNRSDVFLEVDENSCCNHVINFTAFFIQILSAISVALCVKIFFRGDGCVCAYPEWGSAGAESGWAEWTAVLVSAGSGDAAAGAAEPGAAAVGTPTAAQTPAEGDRERMRGLHIPTLTNNYVNMCTNILIHSGLIKTHTHTHAQKEVRTGTFSHSCPLLINEESGRLMTNNEMLLIIPNKSHRILIMAIHNSTNNLWLKGAP